ncbi:ABC transporter substrate-binding protein [Dactylosporangium sp. CA-233914]|uniref:ABC transporter substrate-binding protein n=1 Tax=Dactylosporangium sp. CA-233914 TaxID=3239934 RepID=UPI003D92F762
MLSTRSVSSRMSRSARAVPKVASKARWWAVAASERYTATRRRSCGYERVVHEAVDRLRDPGPPAAPGDGLAGPAPPHPPLALIGNDYVWPRMLHHAAVAYLRAAEARVVAAHYVPSGALAPAPLLDLAARRRAVAVLLTLVGSDLAAFNRAYTESPLGVRVPRLGAVLEENGLLATGVTRLASCTRPWALRQRGHGRGAGLRRAIHAPLRLAGARPERLRRGQL